MSSQFFYDQEENEHGEHKTRDGVPSYWFVPRRQLCAGSGKLLPVPANVLI